MNQMNPIEARKSAIQAKTIEFAPSKSDMPNDEHGKMKFTTGRHRGRMVWKVESGYLRYVVENWVDDPIVEACRSELDRRLDSESLYSGGQNDMTGHRYDRRRQRCHG